MERNPPAVNLQHALDFFIEPILVLALIITPFLVGLTGLYTLGIVELSAFLILFLWLLKSIAKGSIEFIRIPVNITIALFLIFVAVQYFFINGFISDFILGEIYRQKIRGEALRIISYLVFFYVVLHNFQDRKKINRLISFLIFSGFVLSILGITQKLSGAQNIFWMNTVDRNQPFFASFPNRSHFANYINMIIFLTMGVVFSHLPLLRDDVKGIDKESVFKGLLAMFQNWTWLYVFALVIMSSSLFYSVSRGGIFSFLCGGVLFLVLIFAKNLTKRGYLILFFVFMLILIMLIWINAPGQIIERFTHQTNLKAPLIYKILGNRTDLNNSTIDLIKRYPIFGVGLGAFEFIYNKRFKPESFKIFYVDHAHNDFLEFFSEVGLVGFTIFFITACLYLLLVFKMILKRHDPFVIGVGSGAVAGIFSMGIHSFFDFSLHVTPNGVLFFVIAALALVITNSQTLDYKETSGLLKIRSLSIRSSLLKFAILLGLVIIFFNIAQFIINPYIADRICEDKKTDIYNNLIEGIRLDPLNDKYHFLLARVYISESRIKMDKREEYIKSAIKEIKEAIRINPWKEYYSKYLNWILKTFKP